MPETKEEEENIKSDPMDKNGQTNSKKSAHPEQWKFKIFALLLGMITNGMCASLLGPTLVDLGELYNADTKMMAGAILGISLGYLLGVILCGLGFERFNYEMQLALDCTLIGIFNIIPPLTGSLAGFIGTSVLAGTTRGFYDSAGSAYVVYVMKGHRLQDSAMQAFNGIWSLGATLGPLIAQPFLSPKGESSLFNSSNSTMHHIAGQPLNFSDKNVTEILEIHSKTIKVQYAYLVTGVITVISSSFLWIIFALGTKNILQHKVKSPRNYHSSGYKQKHSFTIVVLFLMFFFYFFYITAENLPGYFLASWSQKALKWPKQRGSILTSILWGFHGIGRLIGLLIAVWVSSRKLLYLCTVLTAGSYIMLLTLYPFNDVFVWISVATAGLGLSCSFGAIIMWASHHIQITGMAVGTFLVGSSCGKLISPIPTAYLFQEYSADWLLYIILGAAILDVITVVLLELHIKLFSNKKAEVQLDQDIELSKLSIQNGKS